MVRFYASVYLVPPSCLYCQGAMGGALDRSLASKDPYQVDCFQEEYPQEAGGGAGGGVVI